ncbi:putative monovalent cation/H+ antiporter subunit A [Skermanella rosea]|uniref:putative monovalent cation/H+ antiporter subunit A n=1 Tax=Skermanella rosea TaxID=1817965 RepID=UPI001933AE95|nr:putative monovalent cation/H+ antiporter subunit A [Skermanella rosea]UEM04469.1 putative monovalent cation/H+ antiporter subunit A [Skermanella rosea]
MLSAILGIFAWALVAPIVAGRLPKLGGWVLAVVPAALTVWFAGFLPEIAAGGVVREVVPWIPGLGVNLSFYLDGLSLTFALMVCGIGTLIVIYCGGYLHGDPMLPRFFLYILAFMASMLGVVLADNVISLIVFWELTSVTSFLLIGYLHDSPKSRRSALQALLVTSLGGLVMMAGLILLGIAGGSFELSELAGQGDLLREHPLYLAVLILILVGTFTKSAQFPFHFWLPNAMDAPTPVSAYLHSATMVKAGVYLMARLAPTLGGTEVWIYTLVGFGAFTSLLGAILAVRQTDLKRILAYTTITALGQLTMLIGIGSVYAVETFAVYLLAHACYKGALFMGVGAIDHETGTREVGQLGGLLRLMPVTAAAVGLAAMSNAGLPPFLGFLGKEFMYSSTVGMAGEGMPLLGWIATLAMLASNALMLVTAGLVFVKPFLGPKIETPKHAHEAPVSLWLGPVVLAAVGLGLGVFHGVLERLFVVPMAASLAGEAVEVHIYLWGGFTTPLGLSIVTVALGAALYLAWPRVKATLDGVARALGYDSDGGWDRILQGLVGIAWWQTRVIQSGYLRHYVMFTIVFTTVAIGATMMVHGAYTAPSLAVLDAPYTAWVLALTVIAATSAAVVARSRLVAILSLGVVGVVIALIFLLYGAPDVAITQFMVETLVVIIVALVLARLPRLTAFERPNRRRAVRDAVISIAFGAVVTAVMLSVIDLPIPLDLSEYFATRSYTEGFGRNVVNVILVDFRAVDTLGEILVVATAGLGAFALLKARPRRPTPEPTPVETVKTGDRP